MKLCALTAALLFSVVPALADSFPISVLQQNPPCLPTSLRCGASFIPLTTTGNPLLHESCRLPFDVLEFGIGAPAFTNFTFEAQVTIGTFTFSDGPTFVPCPPPGNNCGVAFGPFVPRFNTQVNGILQVRINGGANEIFRFRYLSIPKVPEPKTFVLLGFGLMLLGWYRFRYNRADAEKG